MKTSTIAIAHADRVGGIMDIIDSWAVEIEEYAEKLGHNVVDISGPDLTYERMPEILTETKPALLINFSLGRENCLIGNPVNNGMIGCTLTQGNGRPAPSSIVRPQTSNLNVLSGIAVISYSNYTGGQLGQKMIQAGCPALAGFKENLMIVTIPGESQSVFKEPLLMLAKRVMEGRAMGEAVRRVSINLLSEVFQYKTQELISVPLYYNMKGLTILGDKNWRLRRNL